MDHTACLCSLDSNIYYFWQKMNCKKSSTSWRHINSIQSRFAILDTPMKFHTDKNVNIQANQDCFLRWWCEVVTEVALITLQWRNSVCKWCTHSMQWRIHQLGSSPLRAFDVTTHDILSLKNAFWHGNNNGNISLRYCIPPQHCSSWAKLCLEPELNLEVAHKLRQSPFPPNVSFFIQTSAQ